MERAHSVVLVHGTLNGIVAWKSGDSPLEDDLGCVRCFLCLGSDGGVEYVNDLDCRLPAGVVGVDAGFACNLFVFFQSVEIALCVRSLFSLR